mmetsp:Transcript_49079/g.88215  ORF Transcript_49079/g.88215 Transcript_49079/m.88215 type:complete len:88 (-) Transcript_49079:789-1052(-)
MPGSQLYHLNFQWTNQDLLGDMCSDQLGITESLTSAAFTVVARLKRSLPLSGLSLVIIEVAERERESRRLEALLCSCRELPSTRCFK